MTGSDSALVAEGLTRRFDGLVAVSRVSLTLSRGAITAMLCPNGPGKTTTFNVIAGLLALADGHVYFDGTEITHWPPHRITGLARTFQNVQLFRSRRGGRRSTRSWRAHQGRLRSDRVGRKDELIAELGGKGERASQSTTSREGGSMPEIIGEYVDHACTLEMPRRGCPAARSIGSTRRRAAARAVGR